VLNDYNILNSDLPSTYPALKYLILPFAALYISWVAVASLTNASNVSGHNDMGLAYLTKHWYEMHALIGLASLLLMSSRGMKFDSLPWIIAMLISLQCICQYEEYGLDMLGEKSSWTTLIKELLFCKSDTDCLHNNAYLHLWINSYSTFLTLPLSLFFPKLEQPIVVTLCLILSGINIPMLHILAMFSSTAIKG